MEVASRRLAVSAHNVANINTEGFQAMDVVAEQVEIGGVTSEVVPTAHQVPVTMRQEDLLAATGTDVVRETINRVRAVIAYRANAEVVQTASEVSSAILDSV